MDSSPVGSTAVNDVITQRAVTDSMQLGNTRLRVVGDYFCCTIPWAVFCGWVNMQAGCQCILQTNMQY